MKKRVAIARVIAKKPSIIMFDEPTTGLDPILADMINELIIKVSTSRRSPPSSSPTTWSALTRSRTRSPFSSKDGSLRPQPRRDPEHPERRSSGNSSKARPRARSRQGEKMKKEVKLGLFLIAVFIVFAYFIIKTESCVEFFSRGKRYPFTPDSPRWPACTPRAGAPGRGQDRPHRPDLPGRAPCRGAHDDRQPLSAFKRSRAIISTIGFVGEKYIEIVYKEEFKTPNPSAIKPGGEILVIEPFSPGRSEDQGSNNIYERTIKDHRFHQEIVSDKKLEGSAAAVLHQLEKRDRIPEETMLAENGNGSAARWTLNSRCIGQDQPGSERAII